MGVITDIISGTSPGVDEEGGLWYKTLPWRSPLPLRRHPGYARTGVGPGAIPVIGINGLHCPAETRNLTPGIHTPVETFFRNIAPGVCRSGGAKPRERP